MTVSEPYDYAREKADAGDWRDNTRVVNGVRYDVDKLPDPQDVEP